MNEFTKEELEHIATLFKFTEVAYPDYKLNEDLWVKVESMIDNYCDHENIVTGATGVTGMNIEKYSCYEFDVLTEETGERDYKPGSHGECIGYKIKYIYKIYGEGCLPYDDGVIESDEWFDTEQEATLAAIGHIDLLENGEG